jgi:hypothetical protein
MFHVEQGRDVFIMAVRASILKAMGCRNLDLSYTACMYSTDCDVGMREDAWSLQGDVLVLHNASVIQMV